ncbi:MAG TPA: hypothetical protein VFE50_16355 [Cyclobacteriaceae bacterium]|nr:hypothetical protein [Cyclobacteriaceae bacterium]
MIFLRTLRRPLAAFLVVFFIGQIIAPTVSYALTAGPTAPEFSTFEPVDTTDMVSMSTGDFIYNTPVIEVPGPAGGYPLSLSYHAGILPDQEASWVGLGWNINPGSISRLVNGYPDDQKGSTTNERTYWEGGETVTTEIGVNIGVAKAASVSASLVFANDTYRGFGIGTSMGVNAGYGPLEFGYNSGIGPYGNSFESFGLNTGIGKSYFQGAVTLGLTGSAALSNTGDGWRLSGNASLGVSSGKLGASLSSDGTFNHSLKNPFGASQVTNNKSGNISTSQSGLHVAIPIAPTVSLRLARSYLRYWTDETVGVNTYGSLYIPGGTTDNFSNAFDVYDLLDTDIDVAEFSDPEKVVGGSFPDFDSYSVAGQGVGGTIRPYIFNQELYRQDKSGIEEDGGTHFEVYTKSYPLTDEVGFQQAGFRFVNDFSNKFISDAPDLTINSGDLSYEFASGATGEDDESAYDDGALAGSNNVQWYSNTDIRGETTLKHPFEEGFINTNSEGFVRPSNASIGGFMITNASGVNYHYALPALSYGEYMYSKRLDEEDVLHSNELVKNEPYAYSWMLTAVTGPDYVDENENGLADQGDLGYWVNFHYKKYVGDYKWRNPGVGYNKDVDGEFDFYSYGMKEIYYLERINTETHVAVFEKSLRFDGRETTSRNNGDFVPTPVYGECMTTCLANCDEAHCEQGNCDEEPLASCQEGCKSICDIESWTNFPRPLKKLDAIKLYNYIDWSTGRTSDQYLLKKVTFDYSYDLATGTPNSYDETVYPDSKGKLTLLSVLNGGKGGTSLIPPLEFDYGYNPAYMAKAHDMWGFYKSDYVELENENIDRITTTASAANTDAWSLTKILSPVGAEIRVEYESDVYDDVALSRQRLFRTKYVTRDLLDPGKFRLTFWETSVDLDDYFSVGKKIGVDLVGSYYKPDGDFECLNFCTPSTNEDDIAPGYNPILFSDDEVEITEVDDDEGYIVISDGDFYNKISNEDKVVSNSALFGSNLWIYELTYTDDEAYPDYFPAGFVTLPDVPKLGGGLRVKSISVVGENQTSKTKFEYSDGVTSYEPFQILPPLIIPEYAAVANPIRTKIEIRKAMLRNFNSTINIARQVPGPGVLYGYVKMKEEVTSEGVTTELPNYSAFEFETYKEGMVDIRKVRTDYYQDGEYEGMLYDVVNTANVTLKDFSSRVGGMKSVTLFKTEGDVMVSKTTSKYAHDGFDSYDDNVDEYEPLLSSDYNDQGVLNETYARARLVLFKRGAKIPYQTRPDDDLGMVFHDEYRLLGVVSQHQEFPSIKIGEETVNYKTGLKTESAMEKFDFYSGKAIRTATTDSYGNKFVTVVEPAYRQYPEMGLKLGHPGRKNMLTQSAGSTTYKVNGSGIPIGVVSASAQTWSNEVPVLGLAGPLTSVWRPHQSYLWDGTVALQPDGLYSYDDFASYLFNYGIPGDDARWQKTAEVTLVDTYSRELEGIDLNGNYGAVRSDPSNARIIAAAGNSKYEQMAYAGAEYMAGNTSKEGGVDRGSGTPSAARAHTGKYSLLVDSKTSGFNFTLTDPGVDRKYKASVWVYVPGEGETQGELDKVKLSYTVGGVTHSASPVHQKNKSKSWYLLELTVAPNNTEVTISVSNNSVRGAYFDDFRVHPLDGSMVSYVYDAFSRELTDILDGNNFYTHFDYDVQGRLIRTKKEQLNFDFGTDLESFKPDKVQAEFIYNYGRNN